MIILLTIYQSKAQNILTNSNNLLSLSISCPNNPQCIYSGQDLFPVTTKIINNSNQNLEIPLEAIKYFLTTSYLKNTQTGTIVGNFVPPGIFIPELLQQLTLLPAHTEIIMTGNYTKKYLKHIFNKESTNQITLYKSMIVYIHYQGSKEPIGTYKNGKFEPKRFILKAERIITKK
ncbi:unnamed protein product [Commensalibacter papalotli (ex Botero et al. 2024)]|uniref:Uncharacterized protein n=2 Tax=Commensalibacter papalotli (ex Botero et al. 2024) TaxID=2972766 RepID=A0ABM9HLP7_9PROT|nr:unnamed protein product [Commensalibacter papalotli (ex Botero et al. 2024)]CAI3950919.1 unnamed protein product [Commensalibacter papalotli (ex Botero et al. 2024)]